MEDGEDEQGNYHVLGLVIPALKLNGLKLYVEYGVLPSGFMQAVISNDLRRSLERADDTNLPLIPAYVSWLYNEAPAASWGSPDKMAEWVSRKKGAQRDGN